MLFTVGQAPTVLFLGWQTLRKAWQRYFLTLANLLANPEERLRTVLCSCLCRAGPSGNFIEPWHNFWPTIAEQCLCSSYTVPSACDCGEWVWGCESDDHPRSCVPHPKVDMYMRVSYYSRINKTFQSSVQNEDGQSTRKKRKTRVT